MGADFVKEHQKAVLDLLRGTKPGRILDAGSGGDAIGRVLKERGFDVFSLDLYARPSLEKRSVVGDMNGGLPFIDGIFDYILCSETLQYLENHALLFREFKRILKNNGSIILSLPNVLNAGARLYFLRRGYHKHFKPIRTVDPSKGWDAIAYNPISYVEILELMKGNNFELKAIKASRLKASDLPIYLFLKALYSLGLLFERNEEKAALIRRLSSSEALLGDHLIMRFSLKKAPLSA